MYTTITKYTDKSSILNNIKLSDFKKFLKSKNYKKPYIPIDKYLIKFIFDKTSNMVKYNKDIISFEIK